MRKHISIVVPQGECIVSSIVGSFKAFRAANRYLEQTGRKPMFEINLVGLTESSHFYDGLFSVHPDRMPGQVTQTDLIIIPAVEPQAVGLNAEFIPWILKHHRQGAELASLCVGSFLLAATGLLDGRKCTTHWMAAEKFREIYPAIELIPEKIITDEQGIYTSGGAYSFMNLILYIIDKYAGREVAVYLSKLFEIDLYRDSQSRFNIFIGQKGHEDAPILQAQEYIEKHAASKITVNELAGLFLISRRNFERRFKKATANTPVEYLQRVRIEAAKKSLEAGRENINEIMYSVGYTDSKAFRTMFKKITGLSPLNYRRKYHRDANYLNN